MGFGIYFFTFSALLYVYSNFYARCKRNRGRHIKRFGIETEAIILFIDIPEKPQSRQAAKVQVQIEPVQGRNFVATLTDVPRTLVNSFKVGDKVQVKYLAKNQKEVAFVKLTNLN